MSIIYGMLTFCDSETSFEMAETEKDRQLVLIPGRLDASLRWHLSIDTMASTDRDSVYEGKTD